MTILAIDDIALDPELQPRAEIDRNTVEHYSQALNDGAKFPPVTVFADGDSNWLADGYHRYYARRELGLTEIEADVRNGSKEDALRFSLAANHAHGKPRTERDYQRAYNVAVRNGIIEPWNAVGLSDLIKCTKRHATNLTKDARDVRERQRDDDVRSKTAEGKTVRQISQEIGASIGTVHNVQKRNSSFSEQPLVEVAQMTTPHVWAQPQSLTQFRLDTEQITPSHASILPEQPAEEAFEQAAAPAKRWTIGRHTIVHSDCLTELRQMDAASVDVVVTSPPYNIGIEYRSHSDDMPRIEYLSWLTEIGAELRRVLKRNGSFFLNVGSTNKDPWIESDVACALRNLFRLQNHIIWVKSIAVGAKMIGHYKPITSDRFLNQNYESVFHFTLSGEVQVDRLAIGMPFEDKSNIERRGHVVDMHCAGNTWFIPYETVQSKSEKFDHPAGFPIGLPERCLRMHGNDSLVVLDPFLGAGTTLVAAERLGHTGIGIEIDGHYAQSAASRVKTLIGASEEDNRSHN